MGRLNGLTATRSSMTRLKSFTLIHALIACVVAIVVGSLYPFHDWRPVSAWSADFLFAPPPRYITRNDVSTNLLAYLPLGYLIALTLFRPSRRSPAIIAACLFGALLSTSMESLQVLLPGRIASNLDILSNGLGALTGALLALHHARWWTIARAMYKWRQTWFRPHGEATLGLWLLLLWLLSQFALVPTPGVGVLWLHAPPAGHGVAQLIDPPWFIAMFLELAVIGAFTACLLRPGHYTGAIFLVLGLVFALKLLAWVTLMKFRATGALLSPETLAAYVLALWLLLLPSVARHRRSAALLLLATTAFGRLILVPSPLWPSGSLLNLIGLARHVAALWPWLALFYLIADVIRSRRPR